MQIRNVHVDPSRQIPKNANQQDRRILMSRIDNDGVKKSGWMVKQNDWRDYEVTGMEFFPNNATDGGENPSIHTS